jgi:hypothetical protein
MGSGEGSQAFGHGGYFAGNKRVGESYEEGFKTGVYNKPKFKTLTGEENAALGNTDNIYIDDANRLKGMTDLEWAEFKKGHIENNINNELRRIYDRQNLNVNDGDQLRVDALNKLKKSGDFSTYPKAYLYNIELRPDPEDFIDFNKPLSDQSPAIKTKLSKFFDKSNKSFFKDVYDDWQRYLDDIPEEAQTIAKKMVADEISITDGKTWTRLGELAPDADHNMIHNYRDYAFGFGGPGTSKMTGEAFYRRLEDVMGVKQAPDALSSEGIYGHRYEDAMSRGGRPAKSYNYVVYPTQDPEMIKIMNPPSLID